MFPCSHSGRKHIHSVLAKLCRATAESLRCKESKNCFCHRAATGIACADEEHPQDGFAGTVSHIHWFLFLTV